MCADVSLRFICFLDSNLLSVPFYTQADGRALGSLARSANYIGLVSMDNAWSDHLQAMVNLQENVYLRKYQELNPADEYKREALEMFEGLLDKMRLNTIFLF